MPMYKIYISHPSRVWRNTSHYSLHHGIISLGLGIPLLSSLPTSQPPPPAAMAGHRPPAPEALDPGRRDLCPPPEPLLCSRPPLQALDPPQPPFLGAPPPPPPWRIQSSRGQAAAPPPSPCPTPPPPLPLASVHGPRGSRPALQRALPCSRAPRPPPWSF